MFGIARIERRNARLVRKALRKMHRQEMRLQGNPLFGTQRHFA